MRLIVINRLTALVYSQFPVIIKGLQSGTFSTSDDLSIGGLFLLLKEKIQITNTKITKFGFKSKLFNI